MRKIPINLAFYYIFLIKRLKIPDFVMNLEQIHENDVPPLTILLSQCKLNSIFLYGKNAEKPQILPINKNKSVILKKNITNSSDLSLTDGKSKKTQGFFFFFSVFLHKNLKKNR